MRLLIFFTLFFFVFSFANGNCVSEHPTALKRYTIDLDADPKEHFKQTAHDYREGIRELVNFQK